MVHTYNVCIICNTIITLQNDIPFWFLLDVDECLFNLDKCEGKCTNTPGGYKCSCPYGQVLASDGHSCIKCAESKATTNFSHVLPMMPKNIKESLWHVAICTDSNFTICSGSLINDNLIVTTANCICNDDTTSIESISVKLNKNYGCPTDETNELEYEVLQIICHPSYDNSTLDYNIALLKLTVIINATVFTPVCLPVPNTDTDIFTANKIVGIYGYRELDKMVSSADGSGIEVSKNNDNLDNSIDELYYQNTKIMTNADCSIANNHSVPITDRMICTGTSVIKC